MKQYLALLQHILTNGEDKNDRTGTGTLSVFSRQLRFDLREGFPVVTTKKLAWNACKAELLWFLEGSRDERRLAELTYDDPKDKTTIWTGNAQAEYWKPKAEFEGDLGRVYGVQWRDWISPYPSNPPDINDAYGKMWLDPTPTHIDQIANLIEGIKKDPNGRRHILSAWNVGELDKMALPPCHVMSQFYVSSKGELSCHMYQRSVDVFLGLPFNIASYALLTHMIAHVCKLTVGELIISTGDTHIYKNHIDQVKEQLEREPYTLPTLWLNPEVKNIDDFRTTDIKLINYKSHGIIKAEMAV